MSTLQLDIERAPEDEALAQHIRAQGYMLERLTTELRNSHMASAARKVRQAVPDAADFTLCDHPAGGRLAVLEVRDAAGRRVGEQLRKAAERSIASFNPENLGPVIGKRIDLAEASAWWPGS